MSSPLLIPVEKGLLSEIRTVNVALFQGETNKSESAQKLGESINQNALFQGKKNKLNAQKLGETSMPKNQIFRNLPLTFSKQMNPLLLSNPVPWMKLNQFIILLISWTTRIPVIIK